MVVFFDIDGTIIDDETQQIPPSAIRAVEELAGRGHLAVVNTGRPYSHIDPRVRQIPFAGWICGCGMEIMLDGRWLQRHAPDPAACRRIRDAARECGVMALYEGRNGDVMVDGRYSDHIRITQEVSRMKAKGFAVRELSEENPEFMKLVTFDGPNCRREAFIARAEEYYSCTDRGDTMLELVKMGCTKAGGMLTLLEALGLPREDTLAIGDSTNDLPMFQAAGHSAAMGSGMKELKVHAEFVTDTVMNDGIEKALRHFGLIE